MTTQATRSLRGLQEAGGDRYPFQPLRDHHDYQPTHDGFKRKKPPKQRRITKPKEPPRGRAVTVAIGFLCRDGLVVAADKQITSPGSHTFPVCKLMPFRWANGCAIYAYSGYYDTHRAVEEALNREAYRRQNLSAGDVRQLMSDCLGRVLAPDETFQILLGVSPDDEWHTLASITPERAVNAGECEVIGSGDSPLTRYLIEPIKESKRGVSVRQARAYAVDFIAQTALYTGQFIGGCDVYSLSYEADGSKRITASDNGQIAEWQNQLKAMHAAVDDLWNCMVDAEEAAYTDAFLERWRAFRVWCEQEPKLHTISA